MLSFPSQNDKKTFFPTGRVYSKKQTRHTFKYGLTKNLFILFKVFLNLFKHLHSCLPNICTFVRWKMKSRFQHVGLKQKSNVIIFRPCFLLLIMITEISFFCFLFCKKFQLIFLDQNYFQSFFESRLLFSTFNDVVWNILFESHILVHVWMSCFCNEARRNCRRPFRSSANLSQCCNIFYQYLCYAIYHLFQVIVFW